MASLWSYCDESGTHTDAAHTVVAGLFADGKTWDAFGDAWCESLAQEGLTCFHMTDCETGYGEFSHLREPNCRPERERLQRRFISLINAFKLRGYAVGVSRKGYEAQVQALQFHVGEKKYAFPYLFCFEECVGGICGLASEYPREERISFMFDRNKEYQGRAGEIFAIISDYKELSYSYRLGSIAFDDKTEHPGLQAADILAYESYRYLSETRFRGEPERWQMAMLRENNLIEGTYKTAAFLHDLVEELDEREKGRIALLEILDRQ